MHFEIDIEFTKSLSQFKQKPFCKFIHDMKNSSTFLTFWIRFIYCNVFWNTLLI
jgi:hypothetical protein